MTTKTLVILVVIVAIAFGAAFFFQNDNNTESVSTGDSAGLPAQAGLIIGKNAIYVAEQSPSRTVSVAVARLEKSGFVAIHEDNADKPGKILGVSNVLPAGETKNLTPIALSRVTKDGETLYAMIHPDDGDGVFDPVKDNPAQDSLSSESVMMIFTVSMDAIEPEAVNL